MTPDVLSHLRGSSHTGVTSPRERWLRASTLTLCLGAAFFTVLLAGWRGIPAVLALFAAALVTSVRVRLRLDLGEVLDGAVAGNLGLGICLLDTRGRVRTTNSAAESILGWTEADLVGRDFRGQAQVVGSAHWLHLAGIDDATSQAAPREVAREEIQVTTNTGATKRLACIWVPIVRRRKLRAVALGFRDVTGDSTLQRALQEHETAYRGLIEANPTALLISDEAGNITGANERAAELFGWRHGHLLSRPLSAMITAEYGEELTKTHERALAQPDAVTQELMGKRRDGSSFPLVLESRRLPEGASARARVAHFCRPGTSDATAADSEMAARVQSATSAALARAGGLSDAVLGFLEAVGRNGEWELGVALAHRPDSETLSQYSVWSEKGAQAEEAQRLFESHPIRRGIDVAGKVWESGEAAWVADTTELREHPRMSVLAAAGYRSALAVPVRMRGAVVMVIEWYGTAPRAPQPDLVRSVASLATYLGQFIDRTRAEQELARQAHHDALTGLPNRILLQKRLHGSIGASVEGGASLALLLLDLDRFKEINDTLGHGAGDALLQQVAGRLQHTLRRSDTVARLGGDEFAVLLPGTDGAGAAQVASGIVAALHEPYALGEQIVDVGTSVGIAVYPEDGADASTLMRHADVAMYVAKRSQCGHSRYCPDTDRHNPERLSLGAELRHAIESGELQLYYQPKLNLETGAIESVEALLRWPHPSRGLLMPNDFIPVAEDAGLTRALTSWVLHEAVVQCGRWRDEGLDLHIAVNLFPQILHDQLMVEDVRTLLARYEVEPSALTLEITETAIMEEPESALATLRRLRELGVRISIDDFGTGYSSLLYLKRLPVDELKIDKSFIVDMATQDEDAFIARAVIDLGHNLGLQVIAEGVQSQESWNMLQSIGCDYLQGFYVGEPLPADELARWMRGNPQLQIDFLHRSA